MRDLSARRTQTHSQPRDSLAQPLTNKNHLNQIPESCWLTTERVVLALGEFLTHFGCWAERGESNFVLFPPLPAVRWILFIYRGPMEASPPSAGQKSCSSLRRLSNEQSSKQDWSLWAQSCFLPHDHLLEAWAGTWLPGVGKDHKGGPNPPRSAEAKAGVGVGHRYALWWPASRRLERKSGYSGITQSYLAWFSVVPTTKPTTNTSDGSPHPLQHHQKESKWQYCLADDLVPMGLQEVLPFTTGSPFTLFSLPAEICISTWEPGVLGVHKATEQNGINYSLSRTR